MSGMSPSHRSRNRPRVVGLWLVALALPLGLVLLLHSNLPDDDLAAMGFSRSAASSLRKFFDDERGRANAAAVAANKTPVHSSQRRSSDSQQQAGDRQPPLTAGVAVTVTGCDGTFPVDGAAVLRYSLLRHASKRYRYKFYAIYHPDARSCVRALQDVGYELLERDTPVNVTAIQGDYLRGRMPKSGCCGEKELIKFEAFTLTQHPVVVLMDMDMLVLKNLDDLLDVVARGNSPADLAKIGPHLQQQSSKKNRTRGSSSNTLGSVVTGGDVWLLYVSDYYLAGMNAEMFPSQGGFAVLRPNRTIYDEIRQIVLRGNFDDASGWIHRSGASTGIFWGATTFQGLLPYYFQIEQPGHALELDWCLHDNMNSPRGKWLQGSNTKNETDYYCFEPSCQDCQTYSIRDVYSVHFTNCQKPWVCWQWHGPDAARDDPRLSLCREMYDAWFEYRSDLEVSWGRSGRGSNSSSSRTHSSLLGYCSSYGPSGYEPIQQPYGTPLQQPEGKAGQPR